MKILIHNKIQKARKPIPPFPPFLKGGRRGDYALFFIVLALLLFSPFLSNVHAADYVTGQITPSTILQERINFTPGDRALTNMGMKDGLIKGDILQIAEVADKELINPIGRCALVKIDDTSSICEIIAVKKEITQGNVTYINRLYYNEERLYPIIYTLLSKAVDPYPPHKKVNVYIHNVFDKTLNITKYSRRIQEEAQNIFSQKHRIVLKDNFAVKDFSFYPLDDKDNLERLYNLIKNENIDIFITGLYSLENGLINITFHKYDKQLGKEVLPFQIKVTAEKDIEEAKEVILPFKLVEKQEPVNCTISYKKLTDSVAKYGKAEIIRFEANGDLFSEHNIKSKEFDIIAPTDISVTLDGEELNFENGSKFQTILNKGSKTIKASFKRGYFLNSEEALAYTSKQVIKKEMTLLVKKDGDINIEIDLNPEFDKENISFKVFKETVNVRSQIKAIRSIKSDTRIETYVD